MSDDIFQLKRWRPSEQPVLVPPDVDSPCRTCGADLEDLEGQDSPDYEFDCDCCGAPAYGYSWAGSNWDRCLACERAGHSEYRPCDRWRP